MPKATKRWQDTDTSFVKKKAVQHCGRLYEDRGIGTFHLDIYKGITFQIYVCMYMQFDCGPVTTGLSWVRRNDVPWRATNQFTITANNNIAAHTRLRKQMLEKPRARLSCALSTDQWGKNALCMHWWVLTEGPALKKLYRKRVYRSGVTITKSLPNCTWLERAAKQE